MSPLWPDFALARAAWAKAVDSGLVDDRDAGKATKREAKRLTGGRAQRLAA